MCIGSIVLSQLFLSVSLHADQEVPQRDLELEETPMELGGEQGRWEEERLKTASLSFGAKREREQGMRREQERYELILEEDEMIDFVSTAITMKGTRAEKVNFTLFFLLLSDYLCLSFHFNFPLSRKKQSHTMSS